MHRRFWRFLWLFALLAVALGLLVWLFNLKAGFWVRVIDERGHWAQWAATEPLWARLVFVMLYVVYVLIGLPGSILLTMLGGFFFGFLHAVLLSCLAATMGAVGLIALVRVFFRPLAQARLGARYDQWAALGEEIYQAQKTRCFLEVQRSARRFLPSISDTALTESTITTDMFTPRTITKFTGHIGGAIYGAPVKHRQGRTPLQNVYLCGTDQGFLGIIGAMLSGISMANFHILQKN